MKKRTVAAALVVGASAFAAVVYIVQKPSYDQALLDYALMMDAAASQTSEPKRWVDDGGVGRPCSYEHGDSNCPASEVCVPGFRPRLLGFRGGCYQPCDAGFCIEGACHSVSVELPSPEGARLSPVSVCVPADALVRELR
jgi:hypothetical protein